MYHYDILNSNIDTTWIWIFLFFDILLSDSITFTFINLSEINLLFLIALFLFRVHHFVVQAAAEWIAWEDPLESRSVVEKATETDSAALPGQKALVLINGKPTRPLSEQPPALFPLNI